MLLALSSRRHLLLQIDENMKKSKRQNEKLIIYQLFPRIFTNMEENPVAHGSFERNGCGKMNDYTPLLLSSLADLGVNCLWFTGIIEHATKTSFPEYGIDADNPHIVKGEAGSPYAIKDYYDVAPSLATDVRRRNEEFDALVERAHAAGLKMIIDFVPNHTARCYHSDQAPEGVEDFGANDDITVHFSPANNYYYITNQLFTPSINLGEGPDRYVEFPAKATGNDCFTAFCSEYDWYETVKLNYGHDYGNNTDHFSPIPPTWLRMRDILLYWASRGVDGFRCDMVFMVPLPFWHWVIREVKKDFPHLIFIGEIYDVALYRSFIDYGGFDYLYDKVNLYDTLVGIERHALSAAQLTGCWQAVEGIADKMLNFLENHDEVRFASSEFANDPQKVTPFLVASALISRGPFMLYYGQELGEDAHENEGFAGYNNRTTIFDYWSYETMRRWYNGGRCSIDRLSAQQKWLRNRYRSVLRMCNELAPIRTGNFFDLMYVNLQNSGFNPHRLFAFLRYTKKDILLIVCNFADSKQNIELNIPELAFSMARIPEGEVRAKELLTDTNTILHLSPTAPTKHVVGAYDAVILKFPAKEAE